MTLSILCITRAEPHAWSFIEEIRSVADLCKAEFVLVADGQLAVDTVRSHDRMARFYQVESKGYIESVLDEALDACRGDYVLRLDDDESISPAMLRWLAARQYESLDHWKFPRVHFWGDTKSVLMTPQLFPDEQTRLSVRAKSGGRKSVHAGSPFGGGESAPVCIEHHKFIVKSYEERKRIAQRYDDYFPGYGTGGMLPFNLPEDAYLDAMKVVAYGDGLAAWTSEWTRMVQLREVA